VKENDQVERNDLGEVVVTTPVGDCRLEFRRQRGSGDLWCVGSGPLGVMAWPVMRADGLVHARRLALSDPQIGLRSRARYEKWQQVRINDDLLIAIRARGSELALGYLLADGRPFGGGGAAPANITRVRGWGMCSKTDLTWLIWASPWHENPVFVRLGLRIYAGTEC